MIAIKKILVPTDFSENAACAYPYARSMAEAYGAKVVLAHIADVTLYPVGPGQIPIAWERIASEIKDYTEKHFAKVKEAFAGVDIEIVQREGTAFVELAKVARDENIDLIVMATHGHTGIKHLLMGSTAEKVVRHANCPVLTVHPGERSFVLP